MIGSSFPQINMTAQNAITRRLLLVMLNCGKLTEGENDKTLNLKTFLR